MKTLTDDSAERRLTYAEARAILVKLGVIKR